MVEGKQNARKNKSQQEAISGELVKRDKHLFADDSVGWREKEEKKEAKLIILFRSMRTIQ